MTKFIKKLLLLLMIIFVTSNVYANSREKIFFEKIKKDSVKLKGFDIIKNYLNECYFVGLVADENKFDKSFLALLEDLNNTDKYFYIVTSVFGLNFLPKFELYGKKDVGFMFISKNNKDFPTYLFRIPINELSKLNKRDFGKKDASLVEDVKGTPYDTPPYPLIEVFKKASIFNIKSNDDFSTRYIEIDQNATEQYREFLNKSFQFPERQEMSVEDVYSKYLNMSKEIYQCILNNDLRCVKGYCKMGFNINEHPEDVSPLIIFSIKNDKSKIAEFLLMKGANPNVKDKNGLTPLMHAVVANNISLIKLLIKYKANPNIKTNDGVIALDLAKETKNKLLTDYLSPLTTEKGVYDIGNNSNSSFNYITVSLSYVYGFSKTCNDQKLTLSGGSNDFGSSNGKSTMVTIYKNYKGSFDGTYSYTITSSCSSICTGSFTVSGKKRHITLHVYDESCNANIYEKEY